MYTIRRRFLGLLLLIPVILCAAQPPAPAIKQFETGYLRISVLPGWTVDRSAEPELKLTRGKYILSINPMFGHASGVVCGRFSEQTREMHSVNAVMAGVDQPAGGWECAASFGQSHLVVNKTITLENLYTGGPDAKRECTFPHNHHSVWFGSYFCGRNDYSEYTITLAYDSDDVDRFPRRSDSTLQKAFRDSVEMLETLYFKPPMVVMGIVPLWRFQEKSHHGENRSHMSSTKYPYPMPMD
jgi:hypothetical protein